ncbi:hypothetical protein IAR55_002195 [Kwoniella newhampshirensis]|uniref:DUF1772-domain-containing protein n=1 Tax=Kwoniella newhampshirensis TaxID=1651941 RepID=A0AAW0YYS0_9TREE
MTITSTLLSLPAPSITLALGGIGTAYVFFTNISDAQRGIIPLLNGKLGKVDIAEQERVRMWNVYFASAAKWVVGTSMFNAAVNLATSYYHPSPSIRLLTLLSGLFSLTILPTTLVVGLLPINARLHALEKDGVEVRRSEGRDLVQGWEKRHLARVPLYGVAWALSFVAILLERRV